MLNEPNIQPEEEIPLNPPPVVGEETSQVPPEPPEPPERFAKGRGKDTLFRVTVRNSNLRTGMCTQALDRASVFRNYGPQRVGNAEILRCFFIHNSPTL